MIDALAIIGGVGIILIVMGLLAFAFLAWISGGMRY